jgi:hypothetical protein
MIKNKRQKQHNYVVKRGDYYLTADDDGIRFSNPMDAAIFDSEPKAEYVANILNEETGDNSHYVREQGNWHAIAFTQAERRAMKQQADNMTRVMRLVGATVYEHFQRAQRAQRA